MKKQIDLCNYTTSSNKRFLKSSARPAAQCVQRLGVPKGALFFFAPIFKYSKSLSLTDIAYSS